MELIYICRKTCKNKHGVIQKPTKKHKNLLDLIDSNKNMRKTHTTK